MTSHSYTTRTTCRVCGSEKLEPLFSLGDQVVSDFVDPGKERTGVVCPIELVLCRKCTLVQQRYTAPQEFLYTRKYWYRSGVTETMQSALQDVVRAAYRAAEIKPDDVVLDIGSNDGTLLREYKRLANLALTDPGEAAIDYEEDSSSGRCGPITVGVEPAMNLAEEGRRGVDIFIPEFWSYKAYSDAWTETNGLKRAKVITALGMFYDLENPNAFIADVAKVLAPDGVFIAQLMCLKQTLEQGDIGNLCHEHLEFYSLESLGELLGRHGLKLFDIEENGVNGGSYRIYACHQTSRQSRPAHYEQRLLSFLEHEQQSGLADPGTYRNWLSARETDRDKLLSFLQDQFLRGKKIWVYGASTKGNVLLQWYGLYGQNYYWDTLPLVGSAYPFIEAAADRSPEKWGKVTIQMGIPIISEEEFRQANPPYALVLPYAFREEFIEREREWLEKGGKFIFPLPRPEVVGADGLVKIL